jgi:predicted GNAT superfamily acetyltransferase
MRWTFDPMQARNAWLNLGKLGAVVDRFERDFYGSMADEINRGERSDRFTVVWDLRREPGPRTVEGEPADDVTDGVSSVRIPVPGEYLDLRERDPAAAESARDAVADVAERALAAGMQGVAFDRQRSAYVFAMPEAAS